MTNDTPNPDADPSTFAHKYHYLQDLCDDYGEVTRKQVQFHYLRTAPSFNTHSFLGRFERTDGYSYVKVTYQDLNQDTHPFRDLPPAPLHEAPKELVNGGGLEEASVFVHETLLRQLHAAIPALEKRLEGMKRVWDKYSPTESVQAYTDRCNAVREEQNRAYKQRAHEAREKAVTVVVNADKVDTGAIKTND